MSEVDPSRAASDPTTSAWVAANAGAGKTYTLANRVARLLLAGARPERILCLTFTKAAAAEMQGRLFAQLGGWSMLEDRALRDAIEDIGGASGDLAKARRLFAQALETPGGLKVLTIHAFCQILLSRFPLEAGVPPAFEVLDEQSARAMIAQARSRALERAGSGDALLAAAVAHLVTETGERQLTDMLDAALGQDRRRLDRFFERLGGRPLGEALRRAHGAGPGDHAAGVAREFCGELRREIAQLRAVKDWLGDGGAAIAEFLALDPAAEGFPILRDFFLTGKGEPRKKLAVKKLADERPDLLDYLTRLQRRFCDAVERHRAARAAALAEAALSVIGAVRRDYAGAKRLRGVLDYDDLIAEAAALLRRDGAAAWVLFKLDGGIDHVLIDEAQDTSPLQWEIVRSLTAEFFTREAAGGRPRTIFTVGDEKQSIFSFQGADPAQFDINRRHFRDQAARAAYPFLDQPLITSRRSAPAILDFVDKVFADPAARAGLTSGDAPVLHRAHRALARGGIEFWPALKPEDEPETDIYRPVDAPQPKSPVVRLAEKVTGHIEDWLRRGARLPEHDEPIAPKDIMILLPRREPFGSEVIRQLKQRGIPVAGADRIVLAEQIAAMDLIALGRFALQREDDLTLAALLRSPLCGLSEEELFALAHPRRGPLWQELAARREETVAFARAHDFLAEILARADYAPPFEFYAHALVARGMKEKLLTRLGPESADAVDEFMSLALAHERSATPSLEGFLDWLEQGATEIKRDMERGRNEVRVMTVHGAKGLEADIVILPDTASLPDSSRKGQLYYDNDAVLFPLRDADAPLAVKAAAEAAKQEALREHRRLLYVALTRARDRLYVCGFESRRGLREGSWYDLTQKAAQAMGVKVARDGEEIHAIGTLDEERAGPAAPAREGGGLPGWVREAAPAEPDLPRLIRPSDATGPPTFSPRGNGARRFRRGLVVHALLARLPETEPARRRAIALAFIRGNGFGAEAEALADETMAVLDDPQFAPAFGAGSQAEAGLLAELPELGAGARVNGRIDRLAVTDEEVLILDFKTNRPPPAREADVSPVYLGQMALYRAAAQRIFPGRRIVCGLVFTDGPRLLRLSDAVLDSQLREIIVKSAGSQRLDPQGSGS